MKGGNKIFLNCSILFMFAVSMLFTLPLQADDEKLEDNQEQSIDSKKKGYIIIEDSAVPSANRSFINLELFQLAKNKYKDRRIKLNLAQNKTLLISDSYKSAIKRNKFQRVEQSLYTASLITLLVLNNADYFTTIEASKYKDLKEINPLLRPLVKNPSLYLILKLGINAYTYYGMQNLYKKNKKLAWLVSGIANFALSYIVVNNIKQINKVK